MTENVQQKIAGAADKIMIQYIIIRVLFTRLRIGRSTLQKNILVKTTEGAL